MNLNVTNFRDLMHGHKSATIHCAVTGDKVRTLTMAGKLNGIDMVEILAGDGTKIEVPLDNHL